MAQDITFIGQFLNMRARNPDTALDPYDVARESPLENPRILPNPGLHLSQPSQIPGPQPVSLSSPAALPVPPNVTLDSPAALPPPPAVALSNPGALPPPPGVSPVGPAVLPAPPNVSTPPLAALPPPPAVTLDSPSVLPAPPPVMLSSPHAVPAPPPVAQSVAKILPPPPQPTVSSPAGLPPPPRVRESFPKPLPPPPEVACIPAGDPNDVHRAFPLSVPDRDLHPKPTSGYAVLGEQYSPVGGADAGSLAMDPFLYERELERASRLPPGKLVLHSLVQVGMFAQNIYGNVWNPAMLFPPPVAQELIKPALDIQALSVDDIKERQLGISVSVDAALDGTTPPPDFRFALTPGRATLGSEPTVTTLKSKGRLVRAFENVKGGNILGAANSLIGIATTADPLFKSKLAFENGIIPMRLKGDNSFGFRTFKRGEGDQTDDDSVYVPLCFTDLRPIGDTYRTVYFRPIITSFAENFTPEWNKQQLFGRVDPVATYQSTGRGVSLGFKLIAFGPEDIKTIYQKLHWLKSMVYPEYDSNLGYRSGPVVRMRIGDAINALGPEGGRGLPGIIESLDFDYTEAMWELKKGYKLPRHVDVSMQFTIIHDVPIGRGVEGKFGGLGTVNDEGQFSIKTSVNAGTSEQAPLVERRNFHSFGHDSDIDYQTLVGSDKENV